MCRKYDHHISPRTCLRQVTVRYLYIYMIKKNISIKIESSHDQIAVTEEARGSRIVDETELETDSEKFEMTTEGILRVVDGRIEIEYFETEITGMAGARLRGGRPARLRLHDARARFRSLREYR